MPLFIFLVVMVGNVFGIQPLKLRTDDLVTRE